VEERVVVGNINWNMKKYLIILFAIALFGCNSQQEKKDSKHIPTIGVLDLLQDETLAQARKGFYDALAKGGFSEKDSTLKVIYRNAQGDQPTLLQACDYLISQKVDLIATIPTISTIVTAQKTKDIPIFMMVSPSPKLAKLLDANGNPPKNLFGAYETLDYIDSSVALIKSIFPKTKKVGVIYNQAEPQSADAFQEVKDKCKDLNLQMEILPVNNSSETQLAVQALINKGIDAFFAMPDNAVFASFETIAKACDEKKIPVFTCEVGLVARGALVSYGADFYQWGIQAGEQAAQFLKFNSTNDLKAEHVKIRKKVYNKETAAKYSLQFDASFESYQK
jgi:putative ABC transport system substrate-binding protein